MAIASLILGIIGLLGSIFGAGFGIFVGGPFALIAMILGILGRKNLKAQNQPTGMATAGMALGIVGLALGVVFFAACMYCAKVGGDMGKEMQKQMENDPALKKSMDDFNKALKEGAK
ncbi:MAG: DUF4190 domain-containing protein [Myxococcales bacterium]|nr:DUF4190 domain-containing protein [Myxococcales bacterium]